jgi:hypothetical protein
VLSVEKLVTLLPCSESNQELEDVQH